MHATIVSVKRYPQRAREQQKTEEIIEQVPNCWIELIFHPTHYIPRDSLVQNQVTYSLCARSAKIEGEVSQLTTQEGSRVVPGARIARNSHLVIPAISAISFEIILAA